LATVLATGMVGRRPATNVIPARRRDRYAEAEHASLADDAKAAADTTADAADGDAAAATPGHVTSRHSGQSRDEHPRARMGRQRRTDTTPIRRHANA
jgi:hypothetical protein